MKKFAKIMLITLGFSLVTGAIGFLTSKPAPAQAPPPVVPVRVTNTPLPITGNVNVTNSPLAVSGNVAANVSGTVNVGNFPATQNVSGTVALSGTSPVSLSNNTPTTPVYADDERPARNGFAANCTATVDSSGQGQCVLGTLLAGQEAVIETVTCHVSIAPGNAPLLQLILPSLLLNGNGTNFPVSYYVPVTRIFGDSISEIWRFASPLHMYTFGPPVGGVNIELNFQTGFSQTFPESATCSVAGYTVGQ